MSSNDAMSRLLRVQQLAALVSPHPEAPVVKSPWQRRGEG